MNLDELQSVQSRERQTDSLQQLRASFYEDAAEFVQGLREERRQAAERADDPFDSPDVNRLSDDIRTAEQTVEAIYERRVGKVVKIASLAAADMPTEQEGLTKEEQELFETMVTAIEDHRETILDVLGGDAPAGAVSSPPPEDRTAAPPERGAVDTQSEADENADQLDAAAVMGEGGAETDAAPATDAGPDAAPEATVGDGEDSGAPPAPPEPVAEDTDETAARDPPTGASPASGDSEEVDGTDAAGEAADAPDVDRVTVRITEDVGEIFGVDEREYDLAADDVVTLPVTNAEPLIDRDAAESID